MSNYIATKFTEMAVEAIDRKVDGRLITLGIEDKLDERIGEKASERIQRGSIFNLLKEMIEGLFIESKKALADELDIWSAKLRKEGEGE